MPAIHRRTLREIDRLLEQLEQGPVEESHLTSSSATECRKAIQHALHCGNRAKKLRRDRREEKSETHRVDTFEIRRRVWERSQGLCENCGRPLQPMQGQMDHIFGGVGRRRQEQSVETCWRLCSSLDTAIASSSIPGCHERRTLNVPDATSWWRRVSVHLRKHGYHRQALLAEGYVP